MYIPHLLVMWLFGSELRAERKALKRRKVEATRKQPGSYLTCSELELF